MERRTFMAMLGGGIVVVPVAALAQPAGKTFRIGYLAANLAASPHLQQAFLQGMRDLGYVEGRSLAIEYRSAEGKLDRLPASHLRVPSQIRLELEPQRHAARRRIAGLAPVSLAN